MNKKNNTEQTLKLNVVSQYIKDLSFENPNAPLSLTKLQSNPNIDFNVNTNVNKLQQDHYEVSLQISAKAIDNSGEKEEIIFLLEIQYAGLFVVGGISDDKINEVLLVNCPSILFPYIRRIIADITRDGGFPPLTIDPIDFYGLYLKNRENNKD
jgi:preprotein translocase subunit SecB